MSDTITKIDSKRNDCITTPNGEIYKNPSGWAVAGSVMAGTATGTVISTGGEYALIKAGKSLQKYASKMAKLDQYKGNVIWNAIEKMYSDNTDKFTRKGIKWFNYSSEYEQILRYKEISSELGYDQVHRSFAQVFDEKLAKICDKYKTTTKKNGISKILNKIYVSRLGKCLNNINTYNTPYPNRLTKLYHRNPESAMIQSSTKLTKILRNITITDNVRGSGNNAYALNGNAWTLKNGSFRYSLPHELGHCLNNKSKGLSKLWSILYNLPNIKLSKSSKYAIPLMIPITLITLFRRKKVEGEESTTFTGKAFDFVKNHCVGITAALWAPKLIEEANASIKGIKMMKPYLPKKEISMLKGFYGRAYLTYLASAAISTGFILGANTVKNLIDKPKKVEEKLAQANTNDTQHIAQIDINT